MPLPIDAVDRHSTFRNKQSELTKLANSENSRFLVWSKDQLVHRGEQLLFEYSELEIFQFGNQEHIYLGKGETAYYFSIQLESTPLEKDFDLSCLRKLGLFADENLLGMLFHAQGLLNWHKKHQFCASCGGKTFFTRAGHSRQCSQQACKQEHFPRLDPAIICSIVNLQAEPKLLLARQAGWDANRYSVIAGFVEPGESLEQAVKREVFEEVGLNLTHTVYLESQPWPFPSSLMVAFECVTADEQVTLIDQELEKAQWFTARQLVTAIQSGEVILPFSMSVSWRLIDRWFSQQMKHSLADVIAVNSN